MPRSPKMPMKTTKEQRDVIRANLLSGIPSWVCTGLLDDADEAERLANELRGAKRTNEITESTFNELRADLTAANARIEKLERVAKWSRRLNLGCICYLLKPEKCNACELRDALAAPEKP